MNEKLAAFRSAALDEGIPADVVDSLVDDARPCVTLGTRIDGPLVGVFGGRPPVPDGVEVPQLPFVASVDLSLIPAGATDLPLPTSGVLLFFGDANGSCAVLTIPAAGTVERLVPGVDVFPRRELRLSLDMSIDTEEVQFDEEDDPEGEWYDQLYEVSGTLAPGGLLKIGGHPPYHNHHPAQAARSQAKKRYPDAGDLRWEALLSWVDSAGDIERLDHGLVHWMIAVEDLAAGRFDRVIGGWDMA